MEEFLYRQHSVVLVAAMFVLTLLAFEVAFRAGRAQSAKESERANSQVGAVQASMLGLLALMLGFTFSMSLGRFESRSDAVVAEANAIGTAYLRAGMLPQTLGGDIRLQLRHYLELRISETRVSLAEAESRRSLLDQTGQSTQRLWRDAGRAAVLDPKPVPTGMFIQSLNDTIDAFEPATRSSIATCRRSCCCCCMSP